MKIAFIVFCLIGCFLAGAQVAYRWWLDLPADVMVWVSAAMGVALGILSNLIALADALHDRRLKPLSDRMAVGD